MRIEDYLENHTVVKIGNPVPGYICCEIIVDNPMQLISVVRENSCFISEIRWWDRVEIAVGSSIGYGGTRDPRNPETHFFAETDICRVFNDLLRDDEYYAYLENIKLNNSNLDLFPAFDIKKIADYL